jgi:large subunit ribosomal protein L29
MKARDMIEMSAEELRIRLRDLKADLFKATYELRTRQSEDISRRKVIKKDIARIMTVLNARHEQTFVPGETSVRGGGEKTEKAEKKEGKKKERAKKAKPEKEKKPKSEKEKKPKPEKERPAKK